jgi:hypothetical protein
MIEKSTDCYSQVIEPSIVDAGDWFLIEIKKPPVVLPNPRWRYASLFRSGGGGGGIELAEKEWASIKARDSR